MNQPSQEPQSHELDNAIKHFGKPLEPEQKQRVMKKLREEKCVSSADTGDCHGNPNGTVGAPVNGLCQTY